MYEQDYVMRLIKEMIRTLLKLLFQIELPNPTTELAKETEEKNILQHLLEMIDAGAINEAENEVYELTLDGNMEHFKTALLFYNHLNEKNSDFLEQHDFSRKEVEEGIRNLVNRYHLSNIFETFLSDK